MKRKLFFGFFAIVLGVFGYFFIKGYLISKDVEQKNEKIKQDIDFLVKFFSERKELLKEYLPKTNLILLDRDYNYIHLENRNVDLDKIDNLYVVQGNVCAFKDVPELKDRLKDPLFGKCYTIAVDKNFDKFQVGGILKKGSQYVAYINGNTKHNMIKDYKTNFVVRQGDTKYFPYMPQKGNAIKVEVFKGDPVIKAGPQNICKYDDILQSIKLLSDGQCDIQVEGQDFVVNLIYPDGSMQAVQPVGGKNVFSIDYKYDGLNTKLSIADKIGESVYNLVKYSLASDVNVKDSKGNVLTIRGTNFALKSADINIIYLNAGALALLTSRGGEYLLDNLKNILGFDKNNRIVDVLKKYKKDVAKIVSIKIIQDYLVNPRGELQAKNRTQDYKSRFDENGKGLWIKGFSGGLVELEKGEDLLYSGVFSSKTYGIFVLNGKVMPPHNMVDVLAYLSKQGKKYIDLFDGFCQSMGYNNVISVDDFYRFVDHYDVKGEDVYFQLDDSIKNIGDIKKMFLVKDKFTQSKFGILYYDFKDSKLIWGTWGQEGSGGRKYNGIVLICK